MNDVTLFEKYFQGFQFLHVKNRDPGGIVQVVFIWKKT